jgi:tetratricopeptide (TPR) repeat protein
MAIRRNDPCPCGSGLRYKACHGRLDEAAGAPESVERLLDRAQLTHQQGNLDEAERQYLSILERFPAEPLAQHFLGVLHGHRGRLAEAEPLIRQSIAARPDLAPLRNNLGLMLRDSGRTPEALAEFRAALAIDAGYVEAATNLGDTLLRMRDVEGAIAELERVAARPEALAESFYVLGLAYERANRQGDALEALRKARALLRPDDPRHPLFLKIAYRAGQTALALGKLDEGWAGYQWRPTRRAMPFPERLQGAVVVVEEEQGLGDTLFFLRYAEALRDLGARLVFRGDVRLHPLLERARLFEACVAPNAASPPAAGSVAISAGDLPRCRPGLGYRKPLALSPLPERVEKARAALAKLRRPLAVTWRAGTRSDDPYGILFKEIDVDLLGRALAACGRDLVSVQRLPAAGERERLANAAGRSVLDFSSWNDDLEDALALMAAIDGYVGVSNTNMHLRAGAGRTAAVLVPFPPEWRWGVHGPASPWFEGFRVFRQAPEGGWEAAAEELMLYLGS